MKHVTKEGIIMLIANMSDSHLTNTIAMIKRKAAQGISIAYGAPDFETPGLYYDEYELWGREAEKYLGLDNYTDELDRRLANQPK